MKSPEEFAIDAFNIINLHPLPTGSDAREALERLFIHAQQEALESAAVLCENYLFGRAEEQKKGGSLDFETKFVAAKYIAKAIRNLKEGG